MKPTALKKKKSKLRNIRQSYYFLIQRLYFAFKPTESGIEKASKNHDIQLRVV